MSIESPEGTIRSNGEKRAARLLVVEDDDELRHGLSARLEQLGYDVRAVSDGASFADLLSGMLLMEDEGGAPDLIITDVRLPTFNGLSVVEGLRRSGWTTPVFVISAFGDDELCRRTLRLGGSNFFSKPLNLPLFEKAVQEAVSRPRRV